MFPFQTTLCVAGEHAVLKPVFPIGLLGFLYPGIDYTSVDTLFCTCIQQAKNNDLNSTICFFFVLAHSKATTYQKRAAVTTVFFF